MKTNSRIRHPRPLFSSSFRWTIVLAVLILLPGAVPLAVTASPPEHIVFRLDTVDNHLRHNSSMVLGTDGLPQMAFEATGPFSSQLNYARWTGSQWSIQNVADLNVGGDAHIAVDSNNAPHISYVACNPYYCTPGFADWVGSQWVVTSTVEGAGPLVIDATDTLHMAYMYGNVTGSVSLRYAYRMNNQWITTTVDSGLDNLLPPALALNSEGDPQIAYYANGALRYAAWSGSMWTTQVVENHPNVGLAVDLAMDGTGQPHLSYYDWNLGDLRYATRVGTSWITATVDSSGDVGGETSLALDQLGHPHIAYYDATHKAVKYARWTGIAWQTLVVDTAIGDALPITLGLDAQGLPRVAYGYWDGVSAQSSLKLAWGEAAVPYYFPFVMNP
jgi:hypothetical protein